MATGSADVVLSLGVDSTALVAGLRGANDEATKFARGMGSSMAPANQAVRTLGDSVRNYRTEQTQQARTVNFLVRELTDVTGMSKEAASAVGGLGQVMLEAASGGGAFAIGFEAAKFAVTQIIAEWRLAGEQLKALETIQLGVTASLMAGKEALAKMTAAPQTEGDKAFRETLDVTTKGLKGISEEIDKLREKGPGILAYVRAAFGDGDVLQDFEDTVARAAQGIETVVNNASNQAEVARALAQEGQRAAQAGAANKVLADDYGKARERAAKAAADEAKEQERISKLIGSTMERMGGAAEADRGNFPDMFYNQPTADSLKAFQEGQSAPMFGPGNDAGQAEFGAKTKELKALGDMADRTRDVFTQLGAGIGSAFSSIGSAIGGAAGEFISQVGAMIAQTIALVLALAFSDTLMTGPLGVFAAVPMAAGILASLIAMIASVPSFDVGTLSVPRTGLAMVHAGEAILPAGGPAETYRAGLARTGGVAPASRSTNVNVTLNVTAMDGQSVYRVITDNRGQVARAFREMARDGVS